MKRSKWEVKLGVALGKRKKHNVLPCSPKTFENKVYTPLAGKEALPKFHAMIYTVTDPNSSNEYKGIIYTSGFESGCEGYIVNTANGNTTRLEVTRSQTLPITRAGSFQDIHYENDEYISAEYIIGNNVHMVWFKKLWDEEKIILPPHELISVS